MKKLYAAIPLVLMAVAARADDTQPARSLPAMGYLGSVSADEIYDQLKAEPLFAKLNKELVGSPVMLRVTHSLAPTPGGKASGLASGLLAAGTLGIIPVVTNNDLVVQYEVLVNGTVLASYSYRSNFTRSFNLWSKDKTNGLGADGVAWVRSTPPQFMAAAREDAKLLALIDEYRYYFGSPAP